MSAAPIGRAVRRWLAELRCLPSPARTPRPGRDRPPAARQHGVAGRLADRGISLCETGSEFSRRREELVLPWRYLGFTYTERRRPALPTVRDVSTCETGDLRNALRRESSMIRKTEHGHGSADQRREAKPRVAGTAPALRVDGASSQRRTHAAPMLRDVPALADSAAVVPRRGTARQRRSRRERESPGGTGRSPPFPWGRVARPSPPGDSSLPNLEARPQPLKGGCGQRSGERGGRPGVSLCTSRNNPGDSVGLGPLCPG